METLRTLKGRCPYCGESQQVEIDLAEGLPQDFVSDCTVCCRPMDVTITSGIRGDADPVVRLRTEDDVV
jgi:hypothetical protein